MTDLPLLAYLFTEVHLGCFLDLGGRELSQHEYLYNRYLCDYNFCFFEDNIKE